MSDSNNQNNSNQNGNGNGNDNNSTPNRSSAAPSFSSLATFTIPITPNSQASGSGSGSGSSSTGAGAGGGPILTLGGMPSFTDLLARAGQPQNQQMEQDEIPPSATTGSMEAALSAALGGGEGGGGGPSSAGASGPVFLPFDMPSTFGMTGLVGGSGGGVGIGPTDPSRSRQNSTVTAMRNARRRASEMLQNGGNGEPSTSVPASQNPNGNGQKDLKCKKEDEEKLAKIYESFKFDPLWRRLSDALTRLKGDPNAAQILLPLIESLMVVSKHVATPESLEAAEARSLKGVTSPIMEEPASRGPREDMADNFFTFTERHRKILNVMVRANPSLMSGSFSLLVHNPKVLDFDNKRNYFTQQLHKGRREHYTPLSLSVRRDHVFGDSFMFFSRHTGPEIKHGKLNIRFYNEEGVDAGGVTREWFQVLARAMFNPDYALFAPCAADRTTYQPNRMSSINPDHEKFFKFVGRVIAKAIYDGRLLDAYFTRSFYKHILGRPVDYKDLESVDPEYFKSLEWMLQNDITDVLDLTFSVDADDFGETKVIDLKPDGRNINVTEGNKQEYVKLVTEQRLTNSIQKQIDAFLEGFHDIISPSLIRIFSEQELELLISGLPDIDVDSWKGDTELHGYGAGDAVIQWFWRAVRSFDQTEKAKLLQFVTGTSKVPLEGFAHLQGMQGTQKFNIHKAYGNDRLPAAHTCFNQLDLPQYDSYERLRSQLLLAMNEGGEGFGFA